MLNKGTQPPLLTLQKCYRDTDDLGNPEIEKDSPWALGADDGPWCSFEEGKDGPEVGSQCSCVSTKAQTHG